MTQPVRRAVWLGAAGLCLAGATRLPAQGVTGAALEGRVASAGGVALADAEVRVANLANGERWRVTTSGDGRYAFEHLSPGGPYRVEVRAIGFAPVSRDTVHLPLGDRTRLDVRLFPRIQPLEPLLVRSDVDQLIGADRTGPAQLVPESTLSRLPLRGRDLANAALLSPLVTSGRGGLSIAGQNARLTALQVDGAAGGDLLGGVAPPEQLFGARAVAAEALQEVQVLAAPFDVRYGSSAAGVVQAITRSGSNRFEGSAWGYHTSRHLQSRDDTGDRGNDATSREVGLTLAGPIVRDRAAYFLEAGLQHYTLPTNVPTIGLDTTGGADSVHVGFRLASARRLQQILRERYGVDAGTAGAFPLDVPAANIFLKVTLQPGVNSRVELSHGYDASTPDLLADDCRKRDTVYCLGSSAFRLPVRTHATRLTWAAALGARVSNELLIARRRYSQHCETARFPTILVHADAGNLEAGANDLCGGDRSVQHLLELTDDVTLGVGSHQLTIGTHGELIRIPIGEVSTVPLHAVWHFESLDLLEAGLPDSYDAVAGNPARAGTRAIADIAAEQVGLYVQDRFSIASRLVVTAGLRADLPFVPRRPLSNPALQPLGLDNSRTPASRVLWAPRLGVSYDLDGNGRAFVRGGIGWFTGRPAYGWFRDVYSHTGLDEVQIACTGADVPAFTVDRAHQPVACAGASTGEAIAGPVVLFDPAFRFPRTFKLSLGGDARLPAGMIGTVDLLYTRGTSQLALRDRNLQPSTTTAQGEAGRPLFGTIGADGAVRPELRSLAFGRIVEVGSAGGDRSIAVTLQVQKRFPGGAALGASYTYTNARDSLSATEEGIDQNLDAAIAAGRSGRRLSPSAWSVPHRVTVLVAADLPFQLALALFYEGRSGTPFTYTVAGDANADGYGNDAVYVPAIASSGGEVRLVVPDGQDVTAPAPDSVYAALDGFIRSQGCLRRQRGRLLARNSCRNPWRHAANAQLSRVLPVGGDRSIALTLDVFNLLHLVDGAWGLVRGVDDTPLLELAGYDAAGGRGVYRLLQREPRAVDPAESRWRMQLGAKVEF
jgi:Carboxypeptidase regulatory-like domain